MKSTNMEQVFQGKLFGIWQWEQELYDGSTATFERISRADSATIIAVLPDKRIMLVWDEQPHRDGVLSLAGGQVEEGEDPAVAVQRELLEETGYIAGQITPCLTYNPSAKMEWTVYMFIGKNCQKIKEANPGPGEKIEVRLYTFDEFLALGQNTQLRDIQLRIMLLEAQLDPVKKEALRTALYE